MSAAPGLLVCAGLDPSGGAGLIADVRVAAELGTRPVGIVTATTIQNTTGVLGVEPLAADGIREQLEYLLSDVEVRAVKLGLLGTTPIALAIAAALELTRAPVVWDPIAAPSRGDVPFVDAEFGRALEALRPHVTLLTPNARELAWLAGRRLETRADALDAGRRLAERLGVAVLVKAGHLATADATDVLCRVDGSDELPGERIAGGEDLHGTGCALSTAIAAHLARGADLLEACRAGKAYVAARLASPVFPGRGAGSVV